MLSSRRTGVSLSNTALQISNLKDDAVKSLHIRNNYIDIFYIVKLGFTGVCTFFLNFDFKHRLRRF